jgi:hypothetical protein
MMDGPVIGSKLTQSVSLMPLEQRRNTGCSFRTRSLTAIPVDEDVFQTRDLMKVVTIPAGTNRISLQGT